MGHQIPDHIAAQLERADWGPKEALQFYADGNHFDVVDGKTRILDTGAIASNALKSLSLDHLELKGDTELHELREKVIAQQGLIEQLTQAANQLVFQSEEYDFDDGLGRGASQVFWDDMQAVLDAYDDLSTLRAQDEKLLTQMAIAKGEK